MTLKNYLPDANQNTTISGIDIDEGCAPSGINNAIRQIMADLSGGGVAGFVELTRAEYEELPDDKLTDNVVYLLTDEFVIMRNGNSYGGGGPTITWQDTDPGVDSGLPTGSILMVYE